MNDKELIESLSLIEQTPRNGICTFILRNNCPAGWGVIITTAGVNFYYKDQSSETVGPREIMLSTGQSATFLSTKPAGCVKKTFLAMKIVIPGEGAKDMSAFSADAGTDKCWIQDEVILAPKRIILENSSVFDRILLNQTI